MLLDCHNYQKLIKYPQQSANKYLMTKEQEKELIKEAKTNVQAFDKLYRYYLPKIYSYTLNGTNNVQTAQDITSQVFLTAVEKIKQYNPNKGFTFGAWLYKIAHNKIIDHYRKYSTKKSTELNDNLITTTDNSDQEYIKSMYRNQINLTLKKLKPRYQEVIRLRFYSELDIPEIAEVLKVKPTNVSVLLFRALKAFKKEFKRKFPNSEIFESF